MKRGDIRFYEFAAPDKRRPVLVLTRDAWVRRLNDIVVVPITTTIRSIPTEVILDESDGMPKRCAINCDHVQLVARHRVGDQLTQIGAAKFDAVERALLFALGFRDTV